MKDESLVHYNNIWKLDNKESRTNIDFIIFDEFDYYSKKWRSSDMSSYYISVEESNDNIIVEDFNQVLCSELEKAYKN